MYTCMIRWERGGGGGGGAGGAADPGSMGEGGVLCQLQPLLR